MSKLTGDERISALERQVGALITLIKMKGHDVPYPLGYEPKETKTTKDATGSALCRALLRRGAKHVMCYYSEESDQKATEDEQLTIVEDFGDGGFITYDGFVRNFVVPVDDEGVTRHAIGDYL